MTSLGNSSISLTGRLFSSGYGTSLLRSGSKHLGNSSGLGLRSSFNIPGRHFSRFKLEPGLRSSTRSLYKSSSLSRSLSCLKKLETVNVMGLKN
ncbi:hypothetical protein K0M31_017181 [Melipona bicolor]|uniref:Uncharacterized protein n=1 Tax=Melipona bicolor TaxID=60889 RepID=A0AA40G4L8_9HYME|nr:hypothetical protein K0M31_017181 [Melipona bicolor]